MKKKKPSKKSLLRAWGLPESFQWSNLRYKNPYQKGIYWYYVSLEVRKRDVEKYGKCIATGRPITMENSDAGHFCPAANCGRDLLFDLKNIHAESKFSNAFDSGHLIGYRKGLVERYGEAHVKDLEDRYLFYRKSKTPQKDWTASEYELLIKKLPSFQQSNPHPTV